MVICGVERVIPIGIFTLYVEILDHQRQSVPSYKFNVNTPITMAIKNRKKVAVICWMLMMMRFLYIF